jgi:hypothetical protein
MVNATPQNETTNLNLQDISWMGCIDSYASNATWEHIWRTITELKNRRSILYLERLFRLLEGLRATCTTHVVSWRKNIRRKNWRISQPTHHDTEHVLRAYFGHWCAEQGDWVASLPRLVHRVKGVSQKMSGNRGHDHVTLAPKQIKRKVVVLVVRGQAIPLDVRREKKKKPNQVPSTIKHFSIWFQSHNFRNEEDTNTGNCSSKASLLRGEFWRCPDDTSIDWITNPWVSYRPNTSAKNDILWVTILIERESTGGLTLIVGSQKWGFSCKVQRRPPCGHLLKWKLTPENPPVNTMFMTVMAMVLPWKIVEDFQSFVKIRNFDPHFKNLNLARKWV